MSRRRACPATRPVRLGRRWAARAPRTTWAVRGFLAVVLASRTPEHTTARRSGRRCPPTDVGAPQVPALDGRGWRRAAVGALTGVALAVAALPAASAAATPPPQPTMVLAPEPHAELTLKLTGSEPDMSWIRAVALRCPAADGPGQHPEGDRACAELDAVHGDFAGLESRDRGRPCTREFTPVTAAAQGTWRGEPVRWQATYANFCELYAATGAVFQF